MVNFMLLSVWILLPSFKGSWILFWKAVKLLVDYLIASSLFLHLVRASLEYPSLQGWFNCEVLQMFRWSLSTHHFCCQSSNISPPHVSIGTCPAYYSPTDFLPDFVEFHAIYTRPYTHQRHKATLFRFWTSFSLFQKYVLRLSAIPAFSNFHLHPFTQQDYEFCLTSPPWAYGPGWPQAEAKSIVGLP